MAVLAGAQHGRLKAEQPHVSQHRGEAVPVEGSLSAWRVEFDQPANGDAARRHVLAKAEQAEHGLRSACSQSLDLCFQPRFDFLSGDWRAWMTSDGNLRHASIVARQGPPGNGCRCASGPAGLCTL